MSIANDLATFFQDEWSNRMVDSCVVKRETSTSFSTTSGTYSPTYSTISSTACLIRPASAGDEQAGERQAELRMYSVYIPYTVTGVEPDDLVDVTSTNDGFINGKQFVVRNIPGDTYNHRRKLECEEVVND